MQNLIICASLVACGKGFQSDVSAEMSLIASKFVGVQCQ